MEMRPENTNFIMRIEKPLHSELKRLAKKYNMTMSRYVICLINEQLIKESRYEQNK